MSEPTNLRAILRAQAAKAAEQPRQVVRMAPSQLLILLEELDEAEHARATQRERERASQASAVAEARAAERAIWQQKTEALQFARDVEISNWEGAWDCLMEEVQRQLEARALRKATRERILRKLRGRRP